MPSVQSCARFQGAPRTVSHSSLHDPHGVRHQHAPAHATLPSHRHTATILCRGGLMGSPGAGCACAVDGQWRSQPHNTPSKLLPVRGLSTQLRSCEKFIFMWTLPTLWLEFNESAGKNGCSGLDGKQGHRGTALHLKRAARNSSTSLQFAPNRSVPKQSTQARGRRQHSADHSFHSAQHHHTTMRAAAQASLLLLALLAVLRTGVAARPGAARRLGM
jgi:hypothetical protein